MTTAAEKPPAETDPSVAAVKTAMRHELNWQGAKLTIATTVVAIATAFAAYRVVLSDARAQTAANMQPVSHRVDTLEQEQKDLRSDVHEVQMDIRALYRTVTTGQKQERLERPPPASDGGSR